MHKEVALEFYRKFSIFAFRFLFRALDPLSFPPLAANLIRGALGTELRHIEISENCFRPKSISGPSGFNDPPRPFVLRTHKLNSYRIEAGDTFTFDIHFFEQGRKAVVPFTSALIAWQQTGIGPHRSRVQLESVELLSESGQPRTVVWREHQWTNEERAPIIIDLALRLTQPVPATQINVHFLTPTELKQDGEIVERPDFTILFNRLQERMAALSLFYGGELSSLDCAALIEKTHSVRLVESSLIWQTAERRSSRTKQNHPLGGWVGTATYEGPLAPFFSWLRAGYWTGIGRQTVWGKGVITFAEQP